MIDRYAGAGEGRWAGPDSRLGDRVLHGGTVGRGAGTARRQVYRTPVTPAPTHPTTHRDQELRRSRDSGRRKRRDPAAAGTRLPTASG